MNSIRQNTHNPIPHRGEIFPNCNGVVTVLLGAVLRSAVCWKREAFGGALGAAVLAATLLLGPAEGSPLLGVASRVLRGVSGCALVMDLHSGEILDGWHLAKASGGTYGASSVLKPVVAYGALRAGVLSVDERLGGQDKALLKAYGKPLRPYLRSVGVSMDLFAAMAVSDNPFFYEVGGRLGEHRVRQLLAAFGYGKPSGLDPGKEASGTLPTRLSGVDALHFLGWGGPRTRVTAAQVLVATAAFGNGGKLLRPFRSPGKPQVTAVLDTPWAVEVVRKTLRRVVTEGRGKPAAVSGCRVSGKTGSVTDGVTGKRLGVFAGFTEGLGRDVAFVVVVEGASSARAATLAGKLVGDLRRHLRAEPGVPRGREKKGGQKNPWSP